MSFKKIKRLVVDVFENLVKNKVTSIISIVTIFISISLLSIFLLISTIININIEEMKNGVNIVAFLNEEVNEEEILDITTTIKQKENVVHVEYVSPEEGLLEYRSSLEKDGDEEMLRIVEETSKDDNNPIPATLNIQTKNSMDTSQLKEELLKINSIYKVSNSNEVVDFLNTINEITKKLLFVLVAILATISIVLIYNSIKVAIFVRRKEISIIKYLGATNRFIRAPFIFEGFLIGIIGATLSLLVIGLVYIIFTPNIMALAQQIITGFIMPNFLSVLGELVIYSLTMITIVCGLGSYLSLKKYLRV